MSSTNSYDVYYDEYVNYAIADYMQELEDEEERREWQWKQIEIENDWYKNQNFELEKYYARRGKKNESYVRYLKRDYKRESETYEEYLEFNEKKEAEKVEEKERQKLEEERKILETQELEEEERKILERQKLKLKLESDITNLVAGLSSNSQIQDKPIIKLFFINL